MIHEIIEFTATETLNGVEAEVADGHIIIATPRSGGAKYARLHKTDGTTYRWTGDVEEVNAETADDDQRWEQE